MTDLELLASDPSALDAAADPGNFIVQACERAKSWLAEALEHGGIDEIVELKSQAEAIRVYTMSKQYGRDAELAAAEIVRRAERGIGLAIRKGQDNGEIRRHGERGPQTRDYTRVRNGREEHVQAPQSGTTDCLKPGPTDFVSPHELSGNGGGIYAITDGVTDTEFEDALSDAKAEGNLTRSNVVRRIRSGAQTEDATPPPVVHDPDASNGQPAAEAADAQGGTVDADDPQWVPDGNDRSPRAAQRRRQIMREMGDSGHTSEQIGQLLHIAVDTVRRIARKEGIRIPADEAFGRTTRRSIDSNRIVRETIQEIDGLLPGLDLVNFADLDPAEIKNWTDSLTTSIRVLNRLKKQLKEWVQ